MTYTNECVYQTCSVSAYCGEQNMWGKSGTEGDKVKQSKTKGSCIAKEIVWVMMNSAVCTRVQEQQTDASWMGTHPYPILALSMFWNPLAVMGKEGKNEKKQRGLLRCRGSVKRICTTMNLKRRKEKREK